MEHARNRRIRVLFSEGSSTSGRQAVTALGLAGYTIEVCDPNPFCLGRFSKYVRRFHRCPGLRDDPQGYLDFILDLIKRRHYDVLLPIHEQGYLFAKVQHLLAPHVAIALPKFDTYRGAHSKSGFSRILSELGLPQPPTTLVATADELRATRTFPIIVKTPIGTASRGVWPVRNVDDLSRAIAELEEIDAFAEPVVVQQFIDGTIEHAQAVFRRGELVGLHGYVQLVRGAGGGEAIKQSLVRPTVRAHMARLGRHLAWHGALSVDYIIAAGDDTPLYIDCNPRLVEPMSALICGLDLADLLVRVSLGETPGERPSGRDGELTHMAIQAMLGCALRTGSRRDLAREALRLALGRDPYADSSEELTPLLSDWPSTVPAAIVTGWLLAKPSAAQAMAKFYGAHLLDRDSARIIAERIGA
jgi:predicted ATP-grasp superfamily ATP-dependent carboligase